MTGFGTGFHHPLPPPNPPYHPLRPYSTAPVLVPSPQRANSLISLPSEADSLFVVV